MLFYLIAGVYVINIKAVRIMMKMSKKKKIYIMILRRRI